MTDTTAATLTSILADLAYRASQIGVEAKGTSTDLSDDYRAVVRQARERILCLQRPPAFTLPADAPMGEVALCPCCGAEWQQTTSGRARWVPKGIRGA